MLSLSYNMQLCCQKQQNDGTLNMEHQKTNLLATIGHYRETEKMMGSALIVKAI